MKALSIGGCPECRYGDHNPPGERHAPTCSRIDLETARKHLAYYYERYTKREARWIQNYQHSEGRAAILRHENNALRTKLRTAGIIK